MNKSDYQIQHNQESEEALTEMYQLIQKIVGAIYKMDEQDQENRNEK